MISLNMEPLSSDSVEFNTTGSWSYFRFHNIEVLMRPLTAVKMRNKSQSPTNVIIREGYKDILIP